MVKKTRLQRQAERLIEKHGGVRPAARAIDVSHSTLVRYRSGAIKTLATVEIHQALLYEVGP